jgi:hypothetical protein
MTNEEIIKGLQAVNEHIGKHFNEGAAWMAEFIDNAIQALEQESITWIVGKDNAQVAVRNMPIDKMQKICAIIGEEEQQLCEDMRDATEEERKSTKDYIDSISKPTGLQFDDIYEELDFVQPHKKISVKLQPCEDCISRQAAINTVVFECGEWAGLAKEISKQFQQLPPVTPQPKTGHWEYVQYDYNPNLGNWHCSECRGICTEMHSIEDAYNYCPNCGADMRGEL